MILFEAFVDELEKIAQYEDPNRKAKVVGGLAGAGLGAATTAKALKGAGGRTRAAASILGAIMGGLGGRELAEGASTAGRGLRMTAAQTRYALR